MEQTTQLLTTNNILTQAESLAATLIGIKWAYIIAILVIIVTIIALLISINAHLRANETLLTEIKEQNDMSQNVLIDILEEVSKNNQTIHNQQQQQYSQPYNQQQNNTFYQ